MTESKRELINIYEEAKSKRIVLNQSEFAKAVGFSRIHLFNKMEEIPPKIIDKAKKLLETKGVPSNTILKGEADVGDELNRLIELSIRHEATLDVLRLSIESILADTKGRALALVSEELQEAIKKRADRLFDEYSKKR
jgi:hypothetical protein